MLSLPRLWLLHELQRRGTIAETARAVALTPSAVSQQLTQLEHETGVTLLERVGRGVRLTGEAALLVEHAVAIFERLEQAEAQLAAAQPVLRGTLRVASFQSVVLAIVPGALTLLRKRHPELRIEITQREHGPAYEGLLAYEFDLVLGEQYPMVPEPIQGSIDRRELLADPLCLVLPTKGPWALKPRRLRDLANVPWVLDPLDTPTGVWARSVCRRAGFEALVQFDSPDPLLHAHLVRAGHAAAFIPALLAKPHLAGTRLCRLPGDPHRMLYTAVRSGRAAHPAVQAFRSALEDALEPSSAPAWSITLVGPA